MNCGPCDFELPFVAGWGDHADENGVVVIGIHPPTDNLDAVHKKLEKYSAKYPVLIDSPPEKTGGIGLMHDWFGNSWWPHTVLINKQGLVAGHGQLIGGDMPEQIRRLEKEDYKADSADKNH